MCNVLHHDGFAAFRGGDQEGTLTFSNGGDDVDHSARDVFFAFDVLF